MKRFVLIFLSLTLILSLGACGGGGEDDGPSILGKFYLTSVVGPDGDDTDIMDPYSFATVRETEKYGL